MKKTGQGETDPDREMVRQSRNRVRGRETPETRQRYREKQRRGRRRG